MYKSVRFLAAMIILSLIITGSIICASFELIKREDKAEKDGYTFSVWLKIYDEQERLISDLTKENFNLTINGLRNIDFAVEKTSDPIKKLQIITLVDISGSMKNFIEREKLALLNFASQIGFYNEIALMTFSTETDFYEFSMDKERFKDAVKNITPTNRKTDLYFAIQSSIGRFPQYSSKRKILVLLSDGYKWGKQTVSTIVDLEKKINDNGIEIYSIGLGTVNQPELKRISRRSGGKYFSAPDSNQLTQIYNEIADGLKNCYKIETGKFPFQNEKEITCSLNLNSPTYSGGLEFYFYVGPNTSLPQAKAQKKTTIHSFFKGIKFWLAGFIVFALSFLILIWFVLPEQYRWVILLFIIVFLGGLSGLFFMYIKNNVYS